MFRCNRVAGETFEVSSLGTCRFGRGRITGLFGIAAAAFLALASGDAGAQESAYNIAGPNPMPYQPLSEAAVEYPDTMKDRDWSYPTSTQWDLSHWVVPLPSDFTFRYWGQTYSHVTIGGNGCVKGLNGPTPPSYVAEWGCYYRPYAFGYTSTYLRGMIAPFWADWARGAASPHPGGIFYEIEGDAPNRVMKVEWRNVNHYSCNNAEWPSSYSTPHCDEQRSFSFQLWIAEASADGSDNSTLVFSYGTPIGPPPANEPFGGEVSGYNFGYSTSNPDYYFGATVGLGRPGSTTEYVVPETFRSCTERPTTAVTNYFGDCRPDRDWPAEQAIVFTNKAEVVVTDVQVPSLAWGGIPIEMRATGLNIGAADVPSTRVHFYGSRDRVLDLDEDPFLGEAIAPAPLQVGRPVEYTLVEALPLDLEPDDNYYIIAHIDPAGQLDEAIRGNNISVSTPMVIGERTPDLIIESIEAPAEIELGERFPLLFTVRNLGNLPVTNITYRAVLSSDPTITSGDFLLQEGVVTVDMLSAEEVFIEPLLPESVLAGTYHIGVVLDPYAGLHELDKFNNTAIAPSTTLAIGMLEVATPALPPGQIGGDYRRYLEARGGNGVYTWSLAGGELPPGLELREEAGVGTMLVGTPSLMGVYSFTLRVESASMSAERTFEIDVVESGAPLSIATGILPDARVLERYDAYLAATGGRAPYNWTLVDGALPLGMSFTADGRISGAAEEDGTFTMLVEVEDAGGRTAQGEIDLYVGPSSSIRCLTRSLPSRTLDERFDDQLRVSGGTAPYKWTTLEARRLPSDLDAGETIVGDPPEGMTLSSDGRVGGTPLKAGRYLWQVEVKGAEGGTGDRCSIEFAVNYDQGLAITTVQLAAAYAGSPYEVELEAAGGTAPYTWTLTAGSSLPEGLELKEDGTLVGVLDLSLLRGAEARSFDFGVVVSDYRNRITSMPYRLTLRAERNVWEAPEIGKPREIGGCSSAAGGSSLLALIGALGVIARRRRR